LQPSRSSFQLEKPYRMIYFCQTASSSSIPSKKLSSKAAPRSPYVHIHHPEQPAAAWQSPSTIKAARFTLDRFALWPPASMADAVSSSEGVSAHYNLGHGLDVVLIEQPDLERRSLSFGSPTPIVSEIPTPHSPRNSPLGRVDAEGVIEHKSSPKPVRSHELRHRSFFPHRAS
jgi:hypothetical protein